jgi:N-methylhydantoinase A/oxoprolinase/acetone carboxylase beta subunit
MNQFRLGIDVGGTNTDGVILDQDLNCIAKVKTPTTSDVASGIHNTISSLLEISQIPVGDIQYAMLGTTQCTNAIVERKGLCRVGHIRLSLPSGTSLPPLTGWPEGWDDILGKHFYMAHGGYEFNGNEIAPLNEDEIRSLCLKMVGKVDSVSIAGVFSTIRADQEYRVAEIIREIMPDVHLTLSSEIGAMGLLERENASILNAALIPLAKKFTQGFADALMDFGSHAKPLYSQNDGTLIDQHSIEKHPIVTIACGPTNSLRGACHLSGLSNAIVIDVGGTTSDLGVLVNGYPRESAVSASVGGIKTNFSMPDILSVGIGGGTLVHNKNQSIELGPESVAYELTTRSKVFGGSCLTLTDIALRLGRFMWIGDESVDLTKVPEALCVEIADKMDREIELAVDAVKTSESDQPVILVGGGSAILNNLLQGASEVVRPEHFEVANAIGVAIGKIGCSLEKIESTLDKSREDIFALMCEQAKEQAILSGAKSNSLNIISQSDIPLAYMSDQSHHFKVRVVGELK